MSATALLEQVETTEPTLKRVGDGFDATPCVYRWTCVYCHRGYESAGIRGFKIPAKMVCAACTDSYEAKVAENFALEQAHKAAAYRVAAMDMRAADRQEILSRWTRLANDSGSIHERLKYSHMVQLVYDCDAGLEQKPPAESKRGGGAW